MDVKTYYQRIRTVEATIPTQFAVVVSLPTDDGGKKGVMVEVPRYLAAKMVVEGSAEIATAAQASAFQQEQAAAYRAVEDAAAASRVEVTMVSSEELKKLTDDMRKLKSGARAGKE
jgi:D-ribose pyranose/furanose isomerase RbsD